MFIRELIKRQLCEIAVQKLAKNCLFVCNRGDTILRHGGLHTDLNQCNQGSQANPLYVVQEGPGIMSPNPQCQAHPIPLYESNNYIYYVEGLQSLQWLLLFSWTSQHLIHYQNQMCDWPHNGFIKQKAPALNDFLEIQAYFGCVSTYCVFKFYNQNCRANTVQNCTSKYFINHEMSASEIQDLN